MDYTAGCIELECVGVRMERSQDGAESIWSGDMIGRG